MHHRTHLYGASSSSLWCIGVGCYPPFWYTKMVDNASLSEAAYGAAVVLIGIWHQVSGR
ncbi:hypothetical protein [Segatella asaccharophila]